MSWRTLSVVCLRRIRTLATRKRSGATWRTVLLRRLLVIIAHLRTRLVVWLLLARRRREWRALLIWRRCWSSVRRLGLLEVVATVWRRLLVFARHDVFCF